MNYLIELLSRYCMAANISLNTIDNKVDVNQLFLEAFKKGLLSREQYNNINACLK